MSRIAESALGLVPVEFKSLVRTMLAVEPSVRPDALQVTKVCTYVRITCTYDIVRISLMYIRTYVAIGSS